MRLNIYSCFSAAIFGFCSAFTPLYSVEPAQSIKKIFVVGDSISFHAPSEKLGWTGKWGMAASSEANDYVHRFLSIVTEHQKTTPELEVQAVGGGTLTAKLASREKLTSVGADLIIVQMGENDNKEMDAEKFRALYEELIVVLKSAHPNARIVCTGVWRGKPWKDEMIREVCQKHGLPFANIAPVAAQEKNRASSTGTWSNPGVAWHPSDEGMEGYARAIWAALSSVEARASN